ncbi:ester cyclase [Paenibacillus piri]|uniref:Ester cyclase n=1 Tax=Paenibacillus piri TaxID=2547395 RepID=A0A4V2ZS02_9BACL|nr:ester cyclase [Paenibacillus piri]TDF91314.1 ester cyclase [Paenibacillus piri]
MTILENKTIVRRWVDEVLNKHDLSVLGSLVMPDVVNHAVLVAELRYGFENFKRAIGALLVAFPDHHMEIEDMGAEEDKVWYRGTRSGTHLGPGPLPGIKPSGKYVAVQHIHILRLENGKIADHWAIRDDLGFLQQIGLFPAPGQRSS